MSNLSKGQYQIFVKCLSLLKGSFYKDEKPHTYILVAKFKSVFLLKKSHNANDRGIYAIHYAWLAWIENQPTNVKITKSFFIFLNSKVVYYNIYISNIKIVIIISILLLEPMCNHSFQENRALSWCLTTIEIFLW